MPFFIHTAKVLHQYHHIKISVFTYPFYPYVKIKVLHISFRKLKEYQLFLGQ